MSIEEYFGDWSRVIDLDMANALLKQVSESPVKVGPSIKDVYKAFHLCSLSSVRVVMVGQDPYPFLKKGTPIATGIAFANAKDTPSDKYSPSLEVLRESVIDYTRPHGNIIFDPSLEKWEEQGVLLLNTALTCIIGQIGSHTSLWQPFMKTLFTNLSNQKPGIVYALLGNSAFRMEAYINHKDNYIVKEKHPSWYARNKEPMPNTIWQKINNILIGQNGYGIKWYEEDI